MRKGKMILTVLWGLLITPVIPVHAHHSALMYDQDKVVSFTGVVKEFQYTNPHSWLLVNIENEDGTVTTWGFEAEGPSTLMRAGIRKGDLAPGTRISISGHPLKDGRPAAMWIKAVRENDGHEFNPRAGFRVR